MKAFIEIDEKEVIIRIRATGTGGQIGDLTETINEGETFMGIPYEEYYNHGSGEMDIHPEEEEEE